MWGPSPYYDFDDSLNQAVSKLREALGDSASNPRFIETIPRRGYRFIAPVEGRPVVAKRGGATVRPARASAARHVTVGRRSELAQLGALFDAADAGQGNVACLKGEPGIGKTTLLELFLRGLESEGRAFHALRGRCSERLAGEEAYLPLLEAMESLLDSEADGDLLKRVAPAWYVQVASSAAIDPALAAEVRGATQERLKRELVALVGALTPERPLLLCLDDVHWADISTMDTLSYLGMRCGDMRLLIVATYRPTELSLADHAFRRVQLELEGRGLCREIAIGFLAEQDIERYLELEFPGNHFPGDLATQIHRRTEGNPLFMTDLLRDMRDQGLIRRTGESWELDPAVFQERMELPRSISAMIRRKIEKLPDEDRRLLVAAAVQGQEFDAAVVADVVCTSAEEVERRLVSLDQVHEFVRLRGDQTFPDLTMTLRYGFVHALYQNALYDSLTPTQRASQSAAVARAMIGRYGERSPELSVDLAHLFEAAKDAARAFTYFLLAARNAARVAANQEAVKLARRAIDQAERLHGNERRRHLIEATLFLGEVHEIAGQYEEQISAFRSAEALAKEVDDVGALVEAVCGQATGAFWQKRVGEMQEHSRRAVEIAKSGGDQRATALVDVILAREQMCLGDLTTAGSSYDQGIPSLDGAGLSFQAVHAATFRIMLHGQRLEFERARRASEWWLERARETGVPPYQHNFFFAMALGNHGLLSDAMRLLREGIRLAELNDNRHYACRLYNTLGWLHSEIGDVETAVQLNTRGARISGELCNEEAEFNSLLNLARDLVDQGDVDRASECIQTAERTLVRSVWFQWRFRIRLAAETAYHWIVRGDLIRGREQAQKAIDFAEPVMARKHTAWAHKLLGDITALEDRPDLALSEYEAALAVLARHPCPLIEWKIWRSLAGVRKSLRLAGEADEALARARKVVHSLADSIGDAPLRHNFLSLKAIREL